MPIKKENELYCFACNERLTHKTISYIIRHYIKHDDDIIIEKAKRNLKKCL